MHKVLADLNRQLAIEETGRDLLKRGLDISSLLDNLSSPELEALETELGARALQSLRDFEPGLKVAQSLRKALARERQQERERLDETQLKLVNFRRYFERQHTVLNGRIEVMAASAEPAADEAVATETNALRVEAESARAALESAEQRIRNEDAATLEADVRRQAWKLSRARLTKAFYGGVEKDLPETTAAPAAVAALFDEIWDWKRWLSKLTPQHYLYLGAGLVGIPVVYALIESFAGSELWSVLGAGATALTGLATSIRASA